MDVKIDPAGAAATALIKALRPVEACHVCGTRERRVLGHRGVATHDAFSGDRAAEWARPDLVRAVRCPRCSLIYADPMPDLHGVDLDVLYQDGYFPDGPVAPDHERLAKVLRMARSRDRQGGRFLEIGFGRGAMLLAAEELGFEVSGIEVSAAFLEAMRTRAPQLDLYGGALPELPLPAERYDLVYLSQVLEHLLEPRSYLEAIHRILRPGGSVFISVPNEASLYFRMASAYKRARDGSTYHLAPLYAPYHIYGFTRKALTSLLEQVGFRVVAFDARMAAETSGTRGVRAVAERLIFQTERWLNMGYCMDLAAVRV